MGEGLVIDRSALARRVLERKGRGLWGTVDGMPEILLKSHGLWGHSAGLTPGISHFPVEGHGLWGDTSVDWSWFMGQCRTQCGWRQYILDSATGDGLADLSKGHGLWGDFSLEGNVTVCGSAVVGKTLLIASVERSWFVGLHIERSS